MSKTIVVSVFVAALFVSTAAFASTRTITFTNAETGTADDLHIEFTNATSAETKGVNDREGNPKEHNFYNLSIPGKGSNQGSIKLDFKTNAVDLTIVKWWWTTGGSPTADGVLLGANHTDTGASTLSFNNSPASGDGSIKVTIDDVAHVFTTTAGFTAVQSATAFEGFLSGLTDAGFALINANLISSQTVDFVGNLLGDPNTELSVQVLHQDSTQPFTLAPLSVPEPPTWGMGITATVLLLSCNWVRRRRSTEGRSAIGAAPHSAR